MTKLNSLNKKRKNVEEEDGKLTNYVDIRRFIYSSSGHPNGTSNRVEMYSIPTVLGPSIHWKPNASGASPGTIRYTIKDLVVNRCSDKKTSRGLGADRLKSIQSRSEMFEKSYGFENLNNDEEEEEGEEGEEAVDYNDSPGGYQPEPTKGDNAIQNSEYYDQYQRDLEYATNH